MAAEADFRPRATAASLHGLKPRPLDRLQQRNRMLAAMLSGIAGLVLVTAFSVVLLLHYAEVHHLLSTR